MPRPPKPAAIKPIESFTHADTRLNIPTAELQSLAQQAEEHAPIPAAYYPRARPLPPNTTRPRDGDRDPQVIWQGVTLKLTDAQIRRLQNGESVEVGVATLQVT